MRYRYVDLLRGLAALAVMVTHYRWFFAREVGDWRADAPLPLYSILWPIYEHGEIAVPLFWILSGFVFAIAYGKYGKSLSIRDFWLRRFSRLYPLHFATLLIVASLQATSWSVFGTWQVYGNNDLPHFALHLFFASNWFTMQSSFNGPIWSVSIEELIYLAFLLYLKRWGLSLKAILLAFGFFLIERLTHNPVALCGALFFAGVAMAILPAPPIRFSLLGLAMLTAILFIVSSDALPIYLGTPLVLWLFVGLDRKGPRFPQWLNWLGLSTYSIYLLHMPVLIALRMTVGVVPLPVFMGVVLIIAVPTFYWFELPMQRWIRRLSLASEGEQEARSAR